MNCRSRIYTFIFIFALVIFHAQRIFAEPTQSVWDVLRKEFGLNHEIYRAEVQQQILWLKSHPAYIQKLAKSEPYIYHIISEIKKRNLPGELALIPMIESAYNPFARSSAGASGLWQIMPLTGREYGLRQSWWCDSRRSINQSTKAALTYLTYLNKFFNGNWILTIAAYDAGEGSVARSVRRANKTPRNAYFWNLSLPQETKYYIPKLFALAEIIQHPNKYNIKLPHIEHRPYFKEVNINSQLDLNKAAKLAGVSYQSFINLNPEYNRSTTAPGAASKLLIPIHKVETFKRNLADLPKNNRTTWKLYKISTGESLQSIAIKHNTSIKSIQELNKLQSTSLKNQQFLLVPKEIANNNDEKNSNFADLKTYKVIHIISSDDTYQSLQTRYNVSNEELMHWNEHLALTGKLLPGQSIIIWKTNNTRYVVKAGDSLSQIAQNNNKTIAEIINLNPWLNKNKIIPGQEIRVS